MAIGMHTNSYIASLTTKPWGSNYTCTTDLILLQKKGLGPIEHHDAKQ